MVQRGQPRLRSQGLRCQPPPCGLSSLFARLPAAHLEGEQAVHRQVGEQAEQFSQGEVLPGFSSYGLLSTRTRGSRKAYSISARKLAPSTARVIIRKMLCTISHSW